MLDGKDTDGFFHAQAVGFRKGFHERDVFGVLDGAGGIDDATAWLEAGEGVGEDFGLDDGEVVDIGGLEPPADIDATADHAGVRARDVEQDRVEGGVETQRGGLAPVVDGNFIRLDVKAGEVFLKAWEALFVGVGAGEATSPAERGGDEEGLAARGRAGIEDFLAGLRIEEFHRMPGGGILNVEFPLG